MTKPNLIQNLTQKASNTLAKNAKSAASSSITAKAMRAQLAKLPFAISASQADALLDYLDALLLWNKAYNLTAITDKNSAFVKHILDCLIALPVFDTIADNMGAETANNCQPFTLLDIGTGAGLPAAIFAIMRPNWRITALDSNSKKVRFLRQIKAQLALDNLLPVHSRIEEFSGKFLAITSRAFASLPNFVAAAAPYLQDGAINGVLLAMKANDARAELAGSLGADWTQTLFDLDVAILDGAADSRCVIALKRPNDRHTTNHQ